MTTIKEYKAMMEVYKTNPDLKNSAYLSNYSEQIALELIRVIELAEEALNSCDGVDYEQYYNDEQVEQALSEIRKLKGE